MNKEPWVVPTAESIEDAKAKAVAAMSHLSEATCCHADGANALFEVTVFACKKLGLLVGDFPEFVVLKAGEGGFFPTIMVAQDTELQDEGLRLLRSKTWEEFPSIRKRRRLLTPSPDTRNTPPAVLNSLLLRFMDGVADGTASLRIPPQVIGKLRQSRDPGVWADEATAWLLDTYPLLCAEPPNGYNPDNPVYDGGFPLGALWPLIMRTKKSIVDLKCDRAALRPCVRKWLERRLKPRRTQLRQA